MIKYGFVTLVWPQHVGEDFRFCDVFDPSTTFFFNKERNVLISHHEPKIVGPLPS